MARPTDGPSFAEGGGNPSTWPTSKETNGYAANETLPAEDFNGIMENHGDWLEHLERGGQFATLQQAVAATSAADCFRLNPLGVAYAEYQDATGSLMGEISAIAADADQFYVAYVLGTAGVIRGYSLDTADDITTGQEEWTGPGLSGTDTYTQIVSNGTYIGAIFDTEWHVYDVSDGTLVYSGDHTSALHDVAITENWMVVVGDHASNVPGRVIDLSDGSDTALPSWDTGADGLTVAAVSDTEFFGAFDADGSSNQVASITITGGNGGYGTKANVTRTIAAGAQSCSNGRSVFVHNGDTGGYLTAFTPGLGAAPAEIWEQNYSATLPRLCCDAKDVWLALDDTGNLHAVDPQTGALVRTLAYSGAISSTLRPPICSNGQLTFRGQMEAGPLSSVRTFNNGLRARVWRRESAAPHFQQATPEVL